MSFDRSACNVFYTADPKRYDEVAAALAQAKGRIRSIMAHELAWRTAPDLRFHLDASVDLAEQVDAALARDRARNEESAAIAAAQEAATAAVDHVGGAVADGDGDGEGR